MPKKPVVPLPKNLDEAAHFLATIGKAQRALEKIHTDLNEKVEQLTAQAREDARPHEETVAVFFAGLYAYAQDQRETLTENGKRKTVELPTGTLLWKKTPPAVTIKDLEAVLRNLKALGLERFIRQKEEVNKEAMLSEPEVAQTVGGVTIGQYEEFVAKPRELQIELHKKIRLPPKKQVTG